jgi:hypothetical protein
MPSLHVANAGQRTRSEDVGGKYSCTEVELRVVVTRFLADKKFGDNIKILLSWQQEVLNY